MAVTAQLNININSAQADKSVQQLNKDLNAAGGSASSLRSELRQVTQELQGLEPGSARFTELSQKAGELRDQIADTNAVIAATAGNVTENFGRALGNSVQIGVAGFQALQSAQVLFGSENKDLNKTLAQMSALLNLSQAIETFGGLGDKLTEIKAGFTPLLQSLGILKTSQAQTAVASGTAAVAMEGEAVAAGGAAVATGGFSLALNSLPLVAIVTAIGLLIAGLLGYNSATGEASDGTENLTASQKKLQEQNKKNAEGTLSEINGFRAYITILSQTTAGSKERARVIDEINSKYGTTLQNLKDENAFQNQLNNSVINFIALQKARFQLKGQEDALTASFEREALATSFLATYQKDLNELQSRTDVNSDILRTIEFKKKQVAGQQALIDKEKEYQLQVGKRTQDIIKQEEAALKELGITENKTTNNIVTNSNKKTDAIDKENEALERQRKLLDQIKNEYDRQTSAEKELRALMEARTVTELSTTSYLEDENGVMQQVLFDRLEYNQEYFKKKYDLEEQYNTKERTLIENATKREVELLDEKFLKGGITQKKYNEERKKILQNGNKNLLIEELAVLEILKKNNEKELENFTQLWQNKEKISQEQTKLTNAEIAKLQFDFNEEQLITEIENSTKTEEQKNAEKIRIKKDGLEKEKSLIKSVGDEQVKLLKLQQEKELLNLDLSDNEKAEINSKYNKQILETEQKTQLAIQEAVNGTIEVQKKQLETIEDSLTKIDNYLGAVQNAFSDFETTFTTFTQQQAQIRTQAINDSLAQQKASLQSNLAAGLISEEQYNASLTQLEQKQAQDELQLKRKSFRQNKALNIVGATIDGARAVLSTFANTPGELIIKTIAAALAGAFAATQIALIGRQEFTAATGGIVPGNGSGEVDSVPSKLAPGEAVINSKSTNEFLPLLSMINEANGGKSLMPNIPAVNRGQRFEPVYQSQTQTQPIRAYVVESDISQSQRRVNRIINSTTF